MSRLRVQLLVSVQVLIQVLGLVQAQTEVQVHLGRSVVLNCSVEVHQTYWFMEVHSRLQTCISRNIDKDVQYFYTLGEFEKFSVEGNSLRIHNISEDDLTTYSCAKLKSNRRFGFEQMFMVQENYTLTTVSSTPGSTVSNTTQNQDLRLDQDKLRLQNELWTYKVLFFSSLGLTFLINAGVFFCLKRNRPKRGLQIRQTLTQYEEIQFRPNPRPSPRPGPRPGPGPGPRPGPAPSPGARPRAKVRSHPPEEIYSEAQMPQTTHPLYRL